MVNLIKFFILKNDKLKLVNCDFLVFMINIVKIIRDKIFINSLVWSSGNFLLVRKVVRVKGNWENKSFIRKIISYFFLFNILF